MSIVVVKKNYKEYKCVEHNKRKYSCKLCKGNAYCKHGTLKANCKEEGCGGSARCKCGILKFWCRTCEGGGGAYCEHGSVKTRCSLGCGGSALCIHNRRKEYCLECNGSQICEHEKRKERCVECNGSQICEHDVNIYRCFICKGFGICEHNKRKERCLDCNGTEICIHRKLKQFCKICGGSELCKSIFCHTSYTKYDGYCWWCHIHLFPDKPAFRNYKTKELLVKNFILDNFLDKTWICDKKVQDGCSEKRPDLLLDLGYQIIIIEVDEKQHSIYESYCENKRMMILSQDLNHRPIIFIRFNPDSYKLEIEKVKSCFSISKTSGILKIRNKSDWDNRLNILKNTINFWIETKTEKFIEIVYLFYNMN